MESQFGQLNERYSYYRQFELVYWFFVRKSEPTHLNRLELFGDRFVELRCTPLPIHMNHHRHIRTAHTHQYKTSSSSSSSSYNNYHAYIFTFSLQSICIRMSIDSVHSDHTPMMIYRMYVSYWNVVSHTDRHIFDHNSSQTTQYIRFLRVYSSAIVSFFPLQNGIYNNLSKCFEYYTLWRWWWRRR